MINKILDWIDQRSGFVSLTKSLVTEDIPGGAKYWYTFGSATLIVFVIQIITGIFLTFYYAPSAATAWESTKFIYDKVLLGKFVISLHYWGATVMIVLISIHLLQVLIWGAYKRPREMMWVIGVLMFVCTLALGLTGYLLPWDLNAYFATQVSINIAGSAPFAGSFLQSFLQDGPTMGTLTINRFYGMHVWLVPILLMLLVGMHLAVFRHNAPAGPPDPMRAKAKTGKFYPEQIFMDSVVALLVFLLVAFLSIVSPAPLGAKAEPSLAIFQPSSAWYFLPLFGLLRMVPPELDVVASIFVPTIFVLVLLLLPWIDRNPHREPGRRPWLLTVTTIVVIGVVAISVKTYADIYPGLQQNEVISQALLAGKPIPGAMPGGGGPAGGAQASGGAAVFSANCASCHGANGQGTPGVFPPLAGNPFVTGEPKPVIRAVNNGLSGKIQVKGQTYNGQMPPWKGKLTPQQISDVINYIRTSWGNKAPPVTAAQIK